MKYDELKIMGLPKSFKAYYSADYLQPVVDDVANLDDILYDLLPLECDMDKGEDAVVIFKYNESATGIEIVHNTYLQSITLWLSPWASDADVQMYADLVNAIMKKHPRAKLYAQSAILKSLTEDDVKRMTLDRHKYLKKLMTTKESFVMEGLNSSLSLIVAHLRPAPIEEQMKELQENFVDAQWNISEE